MKPNKLRGCSTWRHFLCIHTDITSCVYRAYKDSPNDWSLAEKLSECFWTLWGFTAEQEGIIIHSIKRKADYIYIISDPVHHEYLLLLFGWFIITVLMHSSPHKYRSVIYSPLCVTKPYIFFIFKLASNLTTVLQTRVLSTTVIILFRLFFCHFRCSTHASQHFFSSQFWNDKRVNK